MYERTYHNRVLKQDTAPSVKVDKRFSWKKFFVVFSILVLGVGVFFALRAPALQVTTVTVSGANVLGADDVSEAVMQELSGTVVWVFPRTSIFLINEHSLAQSLKATFPRIETVSLRRTSFRGIAVTLKEYDAVYLWCTTKPDDCYFMDNQGVVYSEAPVFSGTAYSKIITGDPLQTLPFQGMETSAIARISRLEKGLSDIRIAPTTFITISPREMHIEFLHNKRISLLRIDPRVDVDTSLEYIYSGIRAEPLASLFYNQEKILQYLDVRFSNKVVYKFEE